MSNPTETIVELMPMRDNSLGRYKLTVVIPMLLIILLVVVSAIVAISIEEIANG
jgi:hypothetical protein